MPNQTFFNLKESKKKRILDAAINEFSKRDYESANISDIILEANIPRGSFYQYFDNKLDLYKYLFQLIAQDKMTFMEDELNNDADLPFIDLIAILYEKGITFALMHPKYIKISRFLLAKQDEIYEQIMGPNNDLAVAYYQSYIENDIKAGRIRSDINAYQFAKIITHLLLQTTMQNLYDHNDFDFEIIRQDVNTIIDILKRGIEKNEAII
ncbi:MAG: TetR/AcrR family transcriptional regulator [Candidatus Izimaplasma sp.]|nr:TetR/AcrR family transcriptional regulator [Candidatus Izimaplasma bacterium]